MTNLEKRQMKLEDIETVMGIEKDSFPYSYWKKRNSFEKFIGDLSSEQRKSWVFWMNDKLIGYAFTKNKNSGLISLEKMAIASAYQNKGFGAKIVEEIKNSSDRSICLSVRQSNKGAIKLYCRAGFEFVGFGDNYEKGIIPEDFICIKMKWIKQDETIA